MKPYFALVLGLVLTPLYASEPAGFVHWTATELKGYGAKLAPKMNAQKVATQPLGQFGNHLAMIAHREGDGEAEVHVKVADFFVVEDGEASLVVGGEVVKGKTTEPDEIRGPSIKGGVTRKLAVGDAVHIPPNTPHQLLLPKGGKFTYFVIKVTAQ